MKKILLLPAIILLVCCVTVGAFNAVSGTNNRPMTFMESLETLTSIDFSLEETSELIDDIKKAWNIDDDRDTSSSETFGSPDYEADLNWDWLEQVLEFFSSVFVTLSSILRLITWLIYDIVKVVATLFDIIVKFVIGVSVSPT